MKSGYLSFKRVAIAIVSLAGHFAFSQDPPVEFGNVPKADLAMTVCPFDSSADAMILADYGQSYVNDDMGINYERLLRVKLFRKSAFEEWGTHVIWVHTGNGYSRLTKLEGATYSLGADGEIVRTELSDEGIFKEKADADVTRYRLTMPALTPGCVIEIRHKVWFSHLNAIRDWEFQYQVPCRWSEYRITYPSQVMYAIVTVAFDPFTVDEHTEIARRFSGETAAYIGLGSDLGKCQYYRLAMRDQPALKEEPFITCMDDYVPKVQVQLAAYAVPGGGIERFMRSWESVVEEFLDRKDFGKQLKPDGTMRELSAKIAGARPTKLEKMRALYDYVRSSIVWDGKHRVRSTEDLDDVLSAKRGNSADIDFLLMELLSAADIETHPVAYSTRGNGKITDVYSLVDQFNDVIAQAIIDGTAYYLDATDPDRPYDLLPEKALNVRGLVFREGPVQWVNLTGTRRASHRMLATAVLDSTGSLSGSLESVDEEYNALKHRHDLKDTKPLEIARTLFDAASTGLVIDSAWVTGQDSVAVPLHIVARVASSVYAQANGDFLYVNPAVVDRMTQNPLKRPLRSFPVDFAYSRSSTSVSAISIPDAYEVKELPPATAARVGSSDAVYTRMSEQQGNTVTTIERITINRTQFPPTMYASLREFYDRIVSSDASFIVLKKKAGPAAAPRPAPRNKPAKSVRSK